MRTTLCLALVLVVGCSPVGQAAISGAEKKATTRGRPQATRTFDRSNRTSAAAIAPILISVGKLDGIPVTGLRQTDRCQTFINTGSTSLSIDWTKVKNIVGRDRGSETDIVIQAGNQNHIISVPKAKQPEPVGNAYARVNGAFGTMALGCAG